MPVQVALAPSSKNILIHSPEAIATLVPVFVHVVPEIATVQLNAVEEKAPPHPVAFSTIKPQVPPEGTVVTKASRFFIVPANGISVPVVLSPAAIHPPSMGWHLASAVKEAVRAVKSMRVVVPPPAGAELTQFVPSEVSTLPVVPAVAG